MPHVPPVTSNTLLMIESGRTRTSPQRHPRYSPRTPMHIKSMPPTMKTAAATPKPRERKGIPKSNDTMAITAARKIEAFESETECSSSLDRIHRVVEPADKGELTLAACSFVTVKVDDTVSVGAHRPVVHQRRLPLGHGKEDPPKQQREPRPGASKRTGEACPRWCRRDYSRACLEMTNMS
jgi:hypothetical protein